jgi:hypothetical protein
MHPTASSIASEPCSHHQNWNETVSQRIPHVAAALTQANVTCVRIKYDGRFDRGVMEDPVYLMSDGTPVNIAVAQRLKAELRVFFDELLDLRFPEWANAEGAHGEFQWDVGFDRLAHAHILHRTFKAAVLTGL